MTDIPQVTDTMTYEVSWSFLQYKQWSGRTYHVMKIIKQTEKAVYCTIENENYFGFDTWIPKSCLTPIEREAPKSCVREIGDAMCKYIVCGRVCKGYADWESALKYIRYCAKKYGMKYIHNINLNKGFIALSKYPIPDNSGGYELEDPDYYESMDEMIEDELRRFWYIRSSCQTPRSSSYFMEE